MYDRVIINFDSIYIKINKKIKNYFDYNLKFPSYVEGLNYIRDNFIKL